VQFPLSKQRECKSGAMSPVTLRSIHWRFSAKYCCCVSLTNNLWWVNSNISAIDRYAIQEQATMINPVSSASATPQALPAQTVVQPKAQKSSEPAQDTVHLSAAAKAAASGDVDHDGDSH